MFSAKNYGLPKDLIEAAKRVHEKQLEENLDKRIKKPKNKYPDFTKLSDALTPAFKKIKKQREEDLKAEEVQFTEEELAEAFAIFLEENYYVDMLTEEDLDYVFENEFPQWLEEGLLKGVGKGIGYLFGGGKTAKKQDVVKGKSTVPSVPKNEFGFLDDYYLPAGKSMKKMRDRDARKIIRNKASGPWNKVNAATPVKKPQAEEVQFTEEELAEAFAIFLEENFHVEMLTEEDLDYVFEEEFPQWLEEQGGWFGMGGFPGSNTPKSGEQQKRRTAPVSSRKPGAGNAALEAKRDAYMRKNPSSPSVRRVKAAQAKSTASNVKRGARAEDRRIQSPRNSAMNDVSAPAIKKIPTGQHELDAGRPTSTPTAPKPAAPKPAVRKPALNARRPAPKIDYKTPVTRRGSDGTYQLTSKGRRYVARKEAQERKKPFSASKFFSQMQQDGN